MLTWQHYAVVAGQSTIQIFNIKDNNMIAKIVDNKVVYPPVNADGVINANLDAEYLAAQGFSDIPDAEIERLEKLSRHVFTRLQIRDAFIALGMEETLDLLLANNPVFERYGLETPDIDLNHPVTVQAMNNFSPEEIEALILAIT